VAVIPRDRTTLRVAAAEPATWTVLLDRPAAANALTPQLVAELTEVLAEAEAAGVGVLALRGTAQVFSTGMDLAGAGNAAPDERGDGAPFWALLQAMRDSGVLVVALVEGRAAGGGVGLVAAADVVIAGPHSTFALPEALWGLLPCCVAPFLVQRIGPRAARSMAVLTTPVPADDALRLGLVDQVVDDPEQALRLLARRQARIAPQVRRRLKRFFGALPGRPEDARDQALGELSAVMATDLVAHNLDRYARSGAFPWEP